MCPRTAKAYEALREASKEKIMQAALEIFARYGFEKSSIRQIASHGEVSLGLMYNYFNSKEDLLIAICQRSMEDVAASFSEANQAGTAKEKLERLVKSSFEILAEHRDFWQVFYSLRSQPGLKERLPESFISWHSAIQAQLKAYLSELQHPNPEAAAWLLFATIDGVAQHNIWESNYPLEHVLDELLKTYLGVDYVTA
ncbi:MAG: TetR/AcrR family transcriptional regulator [Trueperaceae bacterium]|nr:TetR/AcrR family transcriptional regulator [Trueperaceae bacterium]